MENSKNKYNIICCLLLIWIAYTYYVSFPLLALDIKKAYLSISYTQFTILYALSYIIKPISGLIAGIRGDIYGRANNFHFYLILIIITSFFISIYPEDYFCVEISLIIFILFRVIMVITIIGLSDNIKICISELLSTRKNNISESYVDMCIMGGVIMAHCIILLVKYYNHSFKLHFFIISIIGVFIYLFQRKNLDISSIHNSQQNACKVDINSSSQDVGQSIKNIILNIKSHYTLFIMVMIINGTYSGIMHLNLLHFQVYITKNLSLVSQDYFIIISMISFIGLVITNLLSGLISSTFISLKQAMYSSVVYIMLIIINIWFYIKNNNFNAIMHFLIVVMLPFMIVPLNANLRRILPINAKSTIITFGHALGSLFIGAINPIVAIKLDLYFNYSPYLLLILYGCCYFIIGYILIQLYNNHYTDRIIH